MKKLFTLLVLISLSFTAMADNPSKDKTEHIPISPIPNKDHPLNPKPLSLNPDIEAFYMNGTLTISFNYDLGEADIVVYNTTTGEQWFDNVYGSCVTLIHLTGDEGYYEINITTDSGDYAGTFVL